MLENDTCLILIVLGKKMNILHFNRSTTRK